MFFKDLLCFALEFNGVLSLQFFRSILQTNSIEEIQSLVPFLFSLQVLLRHNLSSESLHLVRGFSFYWKLFSYNRGISFLTVIILYYPHTYILPQAFQLRSIMECLTLNKYRTTWYTYRTAPVATVL